MGDTVRLIELASMHLIDTVMLMRSGLGNFRERDDFCTSFTCFVQSVSTSI